MKNDQRKPKIN